MDKKGIKKKDQKVTKKEKSNDFQREERLQAVVLADSFEVKFTPLSAEKPKALLPLANIPMIDYTLEFLVSSGVKEIFVFACAHAAQLGEYLERSSWTRMRPQLNVEVIRLESCLTTGDALRYLDSLQLVAGDFVLVNGDIISNCKLDTILNRHRERVKEDKLNVATIVLKKAKVNHPSRALDDDLVVMVNKHTGRLLFYDDNPSTHHVELPLELFEENSEMQVRYDMMDTYIDIYTPEALMLWTDNFDWDTRQDFLQGVLGAEILGNKIYTHEVSGAYAARVKDLRTYDSLSKDIIHRWTFPMVLENNLLGSCLATSYKFFRRNIYKEDGVLLERSCVVGEDTVLGSGCKIGPNTRIRQSVIGRNCVIGANCDLFGCYLWDGVVVEEGCRVDRSIIADAATIRHGATISRGSVVSFGVVVGAGFTLAPYTKLTTLQEGLEDEEAEEGELEEDAELSTAHQKKLRVDDPAQVGRGGLGREYRRGEDDVMSSRAVLKRYTNSVAPDDKAVALFPHPDPEDSAADEGDEGDVGETVGKEEQSTERFYKEVRETLKRGEELKLSLDGIVLEMASLKLSHYATLVDYGAATYLGLLGLSPSFPSLSLPHPAHNTHPSAQPPAKVRVTKSLASDVHGALKKWKACLTKFGRQTSDQLHLIRGLERACLVEFPLLLPLFPLVMEKSYEEDILGEEAVLQWEAERMNEATGPEKSLLESASRFLTWLKETKEEEEGDEAEDDQS